MSNKKCPQCSLVNFSTAEECKRCGEKLPALSLREPIQESPPIEPPPPAFHAAPPTMFNPNLHPCPACGNLVAKDAPTCPHCGKRLKKSRAVSIAVLLVLLAFFSCGLLAEMGDKVRQRERTPYQIEYEVSGSATKADLTYRNYFGDTQQEAEASVPWKETFTAYPGAFLYISAQNQDKYGAITATIKVNGQVIKTTTSTGAYSIATASGRL